MCIKKCALHFHLIPSTSHLVPPYKRIRVLMYILFFLTWTAGCRFIKFCYSNNEITKEGLDPVSRRFISLNTIQNAEQIIKPGNQIVIQRVIHNQRQVIQNKWL